MDSAQFRGQTKPSKHRFKFSEKIGRTSARETKRLALKDKVFLSIQMRTQNVRELYFNKNYYIINLNFLFHYFMVDPTLLI